MSNYSSTENLNVQGALTEGNNILPVTASLSIAAGSTNVALVSIQLKDGNGTNLTHTAMIDVWLSDASTGIGLTASTASGAVTAGASGTDLGNITSKKSLRMMTDATGLAILSITDSGKHHFYVATALPTGVFVSSQLADASYGS